MLTVVVSPFNVANFPQGGGHFWVYMQYVQGLRQLGCDVFWLERFRSTGDANTDAAMLAPFLKRLERFGLSGKAILYTSRTGNGEHGIPEACFGMTLDQAEAVFERAELLLNFHYAISPALLKRFRRTALVDIDPGLLQFWISRGQLSVPAHDLFFTTGETVGTRTARFPDCELEWFRIRPPVCLEQWPYTFTPGAEAFTTVSNWDADDWIVDDTQRYENTKRVAFLQFADLPRFSSQPLELALFLRTEKDLLEKQDLRQRGWRIRHSGEVAGNPEAYRVYVQQSRGEFSCAKRSCIEFQNAWISDRTLCYLASGKPAVVQHTGPSSFLPNGEGLFRFKTLQEAAAAFDEINSNYEHHSRAARRLVETEFDARKIARQILSHALGRSALEPQELGRPVPAC
jgi:Glycosyltransferase